MYIRQLKVAGFGCLVGWEREFPAGGVLVVGPNEGGKSTLVTCIETILFGLLPAESEPWRPWSGEEFAGELELAGEDGGLVIRRSFADNQVTVRRRDADGSPLETLGPVPISPKARRRERTVYESWLRTAIGVDSADLFGLTLYVPQASLEVDLRNLDGLLRSYFVGAGLDVEAVTEALKRHRLSVGKLPSEGRAHRGELDRVREELAQTRSQLEEARKGEGRLQELRTEISKLETSFGEQTQELQGLDGLLTDADKAGGLRTDIARLEELLRRDEADLQADQDRRRQLEGVSAALSEEGELPGQLPEVRAALADWERAREARETAEARLAAVGEPGPEAAPMRRWCLAAAVGSAVLFGFLGAVLAGRLGGLVGAGGGFAAGLLLARWLLVGRRGAEERRLRRGDLAEAEKELRRAAEALGAVLPGTPEAEWPGLPARLEAIEERLRQKADLERRLLSAEDLETLRRRRSERRTECEGLKGELTSLEERLTSAGLRGEEPLESARRRRDDLRREQQGTGARLQALREEAARLRGSMGRPAAVLADEVEELEERERELARRFGALRLAEALWPEAVERFQETYLERYGERVGGWLAELSGGGYSAVRLGAGGTAPEARRAADGRWVPLDRLSQGARDRLYLALRLALAEVMGEQGVSGPLILDDPFVTFDAQRLADAFETLRRVAERRQVILLAHDEAYRELGWPVLELPPQEGAHSAEG